MRPNEFSQIQSFMWSEDLGYAMLQAVLDNPIYYQNTGISNLKKRTKKLRYRLYYLRNGKRLFRNGHNGYTNIILEEDSIKKYMGQLVDLIRKPIFLHDTVTNTTVACMMNTTPKTEYTRNYINELRLPKESIWIHRSGENRGHRPATKRAKGG